MNLVSANFLLSNVGGLLSRRHQKFEFQEEDHRNRGGERKMPGWLLDSASSPFSRARSVFHHHRQKLVGSVKNGIDASGNNKKNPTLPPAARVIEHKIDVEGSASSHRTVTEHIVQVIRETTPEVIESDGKWKGKETTITYPKSPISSDGSSPTGTLTGIDAELDADVDVDSSSIFADSDFNSADEAEVFGNVVITEVDDDGCPEAVSSDWMSSLSRSVEMKSEVSGPVSTEKFGSNSPTLSVSRNCSLPDLDFLALQPLFALDHTPAKSKSSVARSGSHSGRKPPSRLNSVPGSSISGSGGGNFEDSGGGTAHDFLFAKWSSSGVGLDVGKLAADAGRCSGEHHVVVTSATASPLSSFKVENNYQLQSFADFRQCVKDFQDETIEIGRQRIDELHQANNHHQEVVTKNQVTYATVNRAEKLEKSDAVSVSSLLSKSNTDIDEPSWRRELKSRRSLRGSASCNSSSIAVDSRSASPTPSSASWLSEIWHRSTPLAERIRKNSVHDLTGGSSPTPNGSNNDGAGAEASPSSSSRVSRRPSAFNARKTIENRRQQTNGPATVTAPAPRSASEPRDKNVKLSLGGSLEKSKSLSSLEQESQKDETETLLTKSASSPTLERERTKVHSYLFGTSIANQLDYHLEESAASSRNSIAGSLAGESQKFNRNDERRRTYAFEKSMDDHIQTSIDYLKSREESSENEESPFWKNEVKLRSTPQRQRLLNGDVEPSSKRTILELGTSRGVLPSEKMTNPHPVVIKIDRYENRHPASSSSSSNSALEMTRNAEERRSLREKGPFLSKVMLRRSSQSPERQPAPPPPPPTFKAPPEARVEIVSKDDPKPHREKTKELMKLLDSAPKLNAKKESTSKSEENVTGDSLPRPGMPFNVKLRHVVSPGPKEDFDFPAYDFNKPNYLEMIPDLAGKDLTVVESEGTPKPQPKSILKRRSVDNILDEKSLSNGAPPWLEAVQRRNTATVDWNDLENKAGKAEEPKRVSWLEEIVLKKTDTNPSSEDEKEPGPKTYLFGETQETVHSSKLTPPREVTIVESEPVKPQPPATRESLVQKLKISFDQGPEAMKVVQHSDSSSGNVVVKISPTSDGPPIVDIAGSSDQSMPVRPSAFKLTNRVEIIENSKNPSADSDEPAAVEKPVADHLPSTAPVSSHLSTAQHHENNRTSSNHDMDLSVMKHLTSIRLNSEAAPPASLAKEVQPGAVAPCATNAARPISTVIADLKSTSPERKPVVDLKSDAIPGRSTNLRAKLPASLVTPGAPLRLFDRRELDRLSLRETKKKHENESSSPRNRFSADFETKPVTKSASNLLHLLPQAPSKSKLLSQLEQKLKPVAAAQQRSSSSSSSKTENTKKLENEYATIGKTDSEIGFKRRSSTGRNVPEHLRRKKSGDGDKTYDDPWDVKTKPAHNGVGTQHLESSAGKSKEKGARKPAVPSLTQRTPRACRRASNESENSDVTLGNRNNNKQPAVRKFEHPCTDVRIPLASANPVKGRYEKHTPSSRSQPQVPRRTSLERPFSKDKPSSQRSKSAVALRKTGVTRRSTDKLLALVKSAANNVSGSVSSDSSRRVRKRDSGKSTVSSKSSNSSLLSVASHNARNDGSVARPSRKDRRYPNGTESGDEDFTYIDLSKTKKSGLLTSLEQVQDQLKTRQERATRDENLKQRLSDIIDREKSRLRSISASPSRNKSPEDRRRFLFGEKSILEEEEVAEKPKTASPKRKATRKCSLDDILKSNAFVDVEPPERSVSRMSTASRSSAGHEFLVSTLNKSGALTALGDKYRLSSSKYDENEDKFNRSRLASDASTVSEFPASGGMKFSLDNENNIVVEAFDHKPSKAVVIEELTDDVRDDKAETGRSSSGPLRILETVPDFAMAPLQNGDYVSKRHLMLAALSNEGSQPKITEPDSELDVSLNGHEPNKNQLVPSSVQRKTEASSGGTKYVTRTVTTSPQGHTTVTTEGVKNRTMATREILSDGPWSGVREVKGAQDQRLTVEECTKGGSKISRVVTQTHSSRSILTITKLSRR